MNHPEYFFVYRFAIFAHSAHRSDLVAVFVYGFTVGDLAGTLTFQIAEAGDIDQIAGLRRCICLRRSRCRSGLRLRLFLGDCGFFRRCRFLFDDGVVNCFRLRRIIFFFCG